MVLNISALSWNSKESFMCVRICRIKSWKVLANADTGWPRYSLLNTDVTVWPAESSSMLLATQHQASLSRNETWWVCHDHLTWIIYRPWSEDHTSVLSGWGLGDVAHTCVSGLGGQGGGGGGGGGYIYTNSVKWILLCIFNTTGFITVPSHI